FGIQEGHHSYPLPVARDAIVLCDAPADAAWNKFLAMYQRHGRARLTLETRVINAEGAEDAVRFSGQYVLHR
ncbi:MAG: YiiD C-terminal domain-containing protein, partial [Pseudomonadales bacterium]|nr:YiiD C-terminal domain-containing protein [Pseudomonadales bacterium]